MPPTFWLPLRCTATLCLLAKGSMNSMNALRMGVVADTPAAVCSLQDMRGAEMGAMLVFGEEAEKARGGAAQGTAGRLRMRLHLCAKGQDSQQGPHCVESRLAGQDPTNKPKQPAAPTPPASWLHQLHLPAPTPPASSNPTSHLRNSGEKALSSASSSGGSFFLEPSAGCGAAPTTPRTLSTAALTSSGI